MTNKTDDKPASIKIAFNPGVGVDAAIQEYVFNQSQSTGISYAKTVKSLLHLAIQVQKLGISVQDGKVYLQSELFKG